MNFNLQLEAIKKYIEDNYLNYLEEFGINNAQITDSPLDFDQFKKDFTVFIDASKMTFIDSDDCGGIERLQLSVFLVVRNDTVANLKTKLLNASTAFYKMIRADIFDIALRTKINEVNYFNFAATGTQFIMISEFDLILDIEE